ncbi:MAG: hypothetical protein ABIC91_06560 [Nanoarchaeota archaeon]|nr:hypothetical protein [Nanoarchaeota archaeon]MBU1030604.1 hypothetical protein [Nanoarchaeota archaeon]MBU1849834.1 hypothetical protein [Nanoarchaeota archaeon]
MFLDIVIPKKGEEEKFVEVAKLLGTKGLIFIYGELDRINLKKVKAFSSKDFFVKTGFIMKDLKNISGLKKDFDYLFSNGERAHIENKHTDFVFETEKTNPKDSMHYRNSGINQIHAKLLKEKNIVFCFSFNEVLNASDKPKIFGRMMQNVMIAKKYKIKTLFASFARNPMELRSKKDLETFGRCMGFD